MKPYGLTPMFQILRPSRTEDKIWEAVQEAIVEGWSPERFKREVAQAWDEELKEQAKEAQKILLA